METILTRYNVFTFNDTDCYNFNIGEIFKRNSEYVIQSGVDKI